MRDDFYEQSLTHMQRMANGITDMAELSEKLYKYYDAHKDDQELGSLTVRLLNVFSNMAEGVIGLNSDIQEMALVVIKYEFGAISDVRIDTLDDPNI